MMKSLVEEKQESGSKGGKKVATSKTYFRSQKLKDIFCMSITDYELLLSYISDLTSSNEMISGNRPILADERFALTLRYLDV